MVLFPTTHYAKLFHRCNQLVFTKYRFVLSEVEEFKIKKLELHDLTAK